MTVVPGSGSPRRRLIVNADDFGQSAGINEGIVWCHGAGIVTSASLMVRWPWSWAAAIYARQRPDLSVGLHVDLGEWVCRDGAWLPVYAVASRSDAPAIKAEILGQLETFERLVERPPTHLDSHQHVHAAEPARSIVAEIGARLGVPCRRGSDRVAHCGEFYGQTHDGRPLNDAISVEHLIEILKTMPAGTTELSCHPGLRHDAPGMYVAEREQEIRALCDPRVRAAIQDQGIELVSFGDID
jgi:chitin disaccharide deacetylase